MTALLPPHAGTTFSDALMGDPEALDELLRRHHAAVEAVCFRRLRSRTDAEDAVQETMVRGMRALIHVEDPSRLKSYLCRIAERVCLDMLRAGAQAMPHQAEERSDGTDEPETVALERERARLVHQTLQALSERQATALWMRDALGEPVPVVAERLGVTEGSARVLLTRARAKMRDQWKTVAALIPGSGIKLPAFTAKILHLGPFAIPAAIPALALLAAVTIGPAAFVAMQDHGPVTVLPATLDVTNAGVDSRVTVAGGLDEAPVSVTVTQPNPANPAAGITTTSAAPVNDDGTVRPIVGGVSLSPEPAGGRHDDEQQLGGGVVPEVGIYDPRVEDLVQGSGVNQVIEPLTAE